MKIVDFNKYNFKRENEKMYQKIIDEIIQNRNKNKIYYTSDMKDIANKILNEMGKENETVIPVVEIAKAMKFDTFQKKLFWFLSGYISINKKYVKRYKTERIICINRKVNQFQQRFVIAHELAHFLFDYDHISPVYYNTYIKNDHEEESERRANAFAANLLMPEKAFVREYNKAIKINPDPIFVMIYLSNTFKAPRKAVLKRISEVNCRESIQKACKHN